MDIEISTYNDLTFYNVVVGHKRYELTLYKSLP